MVIRIKASYFLPMIVSSCSTITRDYIISNYISLESRIVNNYKVNMLVHRYI